VQKLKQTKKTGYANYHIPSSVMQEKKVLFSGGGYLHQPAPAPILFWTVIRLTEKLQPDIDYC
jgi:hypothetical protein